jgi:hypothetical protein
MTALIAATAFFNDTVIKGSLLVSTFMPLSVFGLVLLFVMVGNPLLGRISKSLALTGREIAAAMAIALMGCCISGFGFMQAFTNNLLMPHKPVAWTSSIMQGDMPALQTTDIKEEDWPAFLAALRSAGDPSKVLLGSVWTRFPADVQEDVKRHPPAEQPAPELQRRVIESLNAIISGSRDFARAPELARLDHPRYARLLLAQDPGRLSEDSVARLNRGVMETLFSGLVARRRPGPVENTPPQMLADVNRNVGDVVEGFVRGLPEGGRKISPAEVPWDAWIRTMLFWAPLVLTFFVSSIGLALVVHRQWSKHEQLPYPTIRFANAILPEEGETTSRILRQRMFWIGLLFVLAFHLNNYAAAWWPKYLIAIPRGFDFLPVWNAIGVFKSSSSWGEFQRLGMPIVQFAFVGFAYFLASDVSLSVGIGPYLYVAVIGTLAIYGINIDGWYMFPGGRSGGYAGAYIAFFLVVVYLGRQYYKAVLRRAAGLRGGDEVEPHAIWGARLAFVGMALFGAQMFALGLEWQYVLLYGLGAVATMVVMSRLVAEAGIFAVIPYFTACAVIHGFLGDEATGTYAVLIMGVVSATLLVNPTETMMPFAVSAFRLAEWKGVKIGPVARWGILALLIGFVIAIPVTLYLQYQHGAIIARAAWWNCDDLPGYPFRAERWMRNSLETTGALPSSEALSGWAHFTHASPNMEFLIAFAAAFLLVFVLSGLRKRFAWWPLHPVCLLGLANYQTMRISFSFLLGWMIKSAVVKYGGVRSYQKIMPLMIGLIAGDLLMGLITIVTGAIYYFATGRAPVEYRVLNMIWA